MSKSYELSKIRKIFDKNLKKLRKMRKKGSAGEFAS